MISGIPTAQAEAVWGSSKPGRPKAVVEASGTTKAHSFEVLADIGCVGDIASIRGVTEVEAPVKILGEASENCSIGAFSHLQPRSELIGASVGRYCSIASDVSIGPGEHPIDWLSSHPFVCDPDDFTTGFKTVYPEYARLLGAPVSRAHWQAHTQIGNDVWIGQRALITRGVTVGDGAIIAGGAVVTRDVPPYEIAGGVPAKVLRFRFEPHIIESLIQLEWWRYDLSPLTASIDYADVAASLRVLTTAIEAGSLSLLDPPRYKLSEGRAQRL